MRRSTPAALAAVALTVGLAAPAAAHPTAEVLPPLTVDLTHTATDNVGFVARLPEHAGSAGGILTGNENGEFYLITDPRGVFTYDVSDPRSPELLDFVLLDQGSGGDGGGLGAALSQEDPSTDGLTLPVDGTNPMTGTRGMHVVDLSDPTDISIVGSMSTTDHTWTCVTDVATGNGCAYAYGRDGHIVDIASDPTSPTIVANWRELVDDGNYTHDFTEVRPGLVMSAGSKPVLLDTTDPTAPIELVRVDENDHDGFFPARNFPSLGYHSVEWAQGGLDDFLVMGTEIAPSGATNLGGSDCEGENSVIETWDARDVRTALAEYDALIDEGTSREAAATAVFGQDRDAVNFQLLDFYDATGRGIFLDGAAPAHALYCAHWMEVDPSWENGGRLVVGYYNRGVRFVDVPPLDADGNSEMTELGWFLGADAYTGSAQWVSDSVIYVSDYARGLDIIEITDVEATGTYTADSALADRALTMARIDQFGIAPPVEDSVPYGVLTMAGLALAAAAMLRRRVAA